MSDSREDHDAALLLQPLRDAELEPTRVSVERAIQTGRRIRRRRKWATVASYAAVVALALVALPTVVSGWLRQETVNPATTEFSVLERVFQVSPAGGFTPYRYSTGRYRHVIELKLTGTPDPEKPAATISLDAAGREPTAWHVLGTPAPEINGRPARWNSDDDQWRGVAWQWAGGAWGFVYVEGTDPLARDRAHEVARAVRPMSAAPVRTPFTVAERTPGIELRSLETATEHTERQPHVGAEFTVDGNFLVSVVVRPRTGSEPAPNSQFHGLAAYRRGTEVVVPDLGSNLMLTVRLDTPGDESSDRQRFDRLVASLRLVDNPGDPRTWSFPLR